MAKGAETIILSLPDGSVSEAVAREIAATPSRRAKTVIDTSTIGIKAAETVASILGAAGIDFIDAPVSGGQAGAENGSPTVMIGGDSAAFAKAEPVIRCFAKMAKHIGPSGAGQLTKMVNQIAIAGLVQGLAEAIHFAEQAGLDVAAVIDTISKGAAQSWQMENRWKTMHARAFDFGFAVDWMRKDLGICLDEASRNGAELPIARIVDIFYAEIQARGGRRWDTSSLITRLGPKSA